MSWLFENVIAIPVICSYVRAQNTEEGQFPGIHIEMKSSVMLSQLSPVHYFYIGAIQTVEIRWTLSNINKLCEYNKYSSKFELIIELNGSVI